jgi:maltose O-acetyltransferase
VEKNIELTIFVESNCDRVEIDIINKMILENENIEIFILTKETDNIYNKNIKIIVNDSRDNIIKMACNIASGNILIFLKNHEYINNSVIQNIVKYFRNKCISSISAIIKYSNYNEKIINENRNPYSSKNINKGFGVSTSQVFIKKEYLENAILDEKNVNLNLENIYYNMNIKYKYDVFIIKYVEKNWLFEIYKSIYKQLKYLKNKKMQKIKLIINIILLKIFGYSMYLNIKQQINLIILEIFNIIINISPFFNLKRKIAGIFKIKIGDNSSIHIPIRIYALGNLTVGENTIINHSCYLDNRNGIYIGNNVSISHCCKIYTLGHDIDDEIFYTKGAPVVIEDFAVIFPNSIIMPGVKIGKGAVVYPGSVVTKDIKEYEVVGGNPAKYIKERNHNLDYKFITKFWFAQ